MNISPDHQIPLNTQVHSTGPSLLFLGQHAVLVTTTKRHRQGQKEMCVISKTVGFRNIAATMTANNTNAFESESACMKYELGGCWLSKQTHQKFLGGVKGGKRVRVKSMEDTHYEHKR